MIRSGGCNCLTKEPSATVMCEHNCRSTIIRREHQREYHGILHWTLRFAHVRVSF